MMQISTGLQSGICTSGMLLRGGARQLEWKPLKHLPHSSRGTACPRLPLACFSTLPQISQRYISSSKSCALMRLWPAGFVAES